MYISKIRVQNYKAFYDSDWIEFEPGINIISGQNHSGKTALLEALSRNFGNIPHKSIKTLLRRSSSSTKYSQVEIGIKITKEEISNFLTKEQTNSENYKLFLPHPIDGTDLQPICNELDKNIKKIDSLEITLPCMSNGIDDKVLKEKIHQLSELTFKAYTPKYHKYRGSGNTLEAKIFEVSNSEVRASNPTNIESEELTLVKIFSDIREKIYRFHAERKNIGVCKFGNSLALKSDASNLVEVIHCLQSRFPSKFNQFNNLVSVVLPHITRISTRPIVNNDKNEVELRIWSIDPETDRDDLAFPLESCGTGVSQVLAILYVVVTLQEPRTIIIDEPQSFLHPGAARKLIEILQDFPQHQYFISTHSPSIISAANPSTITLLKYQDSEATPISISSDDSDEMRSLLDEVGVHLSDVFGSDNILWVEGPTEERCFPTILRKVAKIPLRGTQILAVKNTGDFENKNKIKSEIYFDIYDRLSGGKALLPPAVGFIFDNEEKLGQDITDLKKRSKGKLHFLNRRMYENYLLDPEAISSIANQCNFRDGTISVLEIEKWITEYKQQWKDKKIRKGEKEEKLTDDYWLKKVHAACLLEALFRHFSDGKVIYRKTTHSVKLTEWIVENKPEQLQDIADLLKDILKRSPEVNSLE